MIFVVITKVENEGNVGLVEKWVELVTVRFGWIVSLL